MVNWNGHTLTPMPHTGVEGQSDEVVRVYKTGTLIPDTNTYARVDGTDFHNGTIEVDVCGGLLPDAPEDSRGFIGITFRAAEDGREFECFYIRPTNGRGCADPVRRSHGCQYFSFPGYTFAYFRDFHITGFEGPVDTIALNEWCHIKAAVCGGTGKFYVNGSLVLEVENLRHGPGLRGSVGLYVDNGTSGLFRNLRIAYDD